MARQHSRCLALVYSQVLSWGSMHFVTAQRPMQMVEVDQVQVQNHQVPVAALRSEWYYCQERCRDLGLAGRSPVRTLGLARDLQSPWLQDQTRMCYRYSRRPPERPLGDQIPSRTHIPSSGAERGTQDRLLYHGERVLGGRGRPLFHLGKSSQLY
jgi:hypothetical protein